MLSFLDSDEWFPDESNQGRTPTKLADFRLFGFRFPIKLYSFRFIGSQASATACFDSMDIAPNLHKPMGNFAGRYGLKMMKPFQPM
jgi:hypothetical protein